MAKPDQTNIEIFFKSHEEIKFQKKKDIKQVIPSYEGGLTLLETALSQWSEEGIKLENIIKGVPAGEWQNILPQTGTIIEIGNKLLSIYEQIKCSILVQSHEQIQLKIVDGIGKTLQCIDNTLRLCLPKQDKIANPSLFYSTILSSIRLYKLSLNTTKRELNTIKVKTTRHQKKTSKSSLRFGYTEQFILFLLLCSANWWLSSEVLQNFKLAAKLFILITVLLWFPSQFLPSFKNHKITTWIVNALIWDFGLGFWVYGLGGVFIALLVIYPLANLMQASKQEVDRNAQIIVSRVYRSMGILLLVAGFFLRENMWIIGAVIWWSFTFISRLSFTHFRSSFDMVDELDPKQKGSQTKRRLLYLAFAIAIVSLMLLSTFSGKLNREFVRDIYSQSTTISFGFVILVFAVQAIIPSISTWGGAELRQQTPSQIREMKILLRTSKGLMGFLQLFFLVSIISLLGWSLTALLPQNMNVAVNLSHEFLAMPSPNLIDLALSPSAFNYLPEMSLVFIHTVVFSVFVCAFAYSLAVLYYLFIATNVLTLPIQDALLSQQVLILSKERPNSDIPLTEKITRTLHRTRALRGEVITDLHVYDHEGQITAFIEISADFDTTQELVEKAAILFEKAFTEQKVMNCQVIMRKMSFGAMETQKLFSLTISREEFGFLKNKIEGMDMEYKMVQLGAHIVRHLLPESQIV